MNEGRINESGPQSEVSNQPESNQPESNQPESNQPESNQPESNPVAILELVNYLAEEPKY